MPCLLWCYLLAVLSWRLEFILSKADYSFLCPNSFCHPISLLRCLLGRVEGAWGHERGKWWQALVGFLLCNGAWSLYMWKGGICLLAWLFFCFALWNIFQMICPKILGGAMPSAHWVMPSCAMACPSSSIYKMYHRVPAGKPALPLPRVPLYDWNMKIQT